MNESKPNADTPEKASSMHEVDGLHEIALRSDVGEAAVRWWDEYVKTHRELIVGCTLLQAFDAGFRAGRRAQCEVRPIVRMSDG